MSTDLAHVEPDSTPELALLHGARIGVTVATLQAEAPTTGQIGRFLGKERELFWLNHREREKAKLC